MDKPQISPSLSYTNDVTQINLDFTYTFPIMVSKISSFSQVTIQGFKSSDFTYEITSSSSYSFVIYISTNETIVGGPKLTYNLLLPDDVVALENVIVQSNTTDISLFDYIPISNSEKNAIESAQTQTKTTYYVATGAVYANSALASGTPMLLQGLMLTELIYLIKYIEIKYPPNVLEIFKNSSSSLPTLFFFYKFQTPEEDKRVLPQLYTYYGVLPYFLENNGEYICKNLAILAIVYLSVQLIAQNTSTSIIIRILKLAHSLIVWEIVLFFMLLYWQKFVFYTFSNIVFSSLSFNSLLNLSLASLFVVLESLFLLHLFLILNVISSIKSKHFPKNEKQLHFIKVNESNLQIEDNIKELAPSSRSAIKLESPNLLGKSTDNQNQFFSNNKNSDNELLPSSENQRKKEARTGLIASIDSSFSDAIKTDPGEKNIKPSSILSPNLSPSKFKKTTVLPNFDDGDLSSNPIKLKIDIESNPKEKDFLEKAKNWFLNWRIIKYFYYPTDDEDFLKQYEFMHVDLKSDNIWQTHYVWFDYFRQTLLSILVVVFHFEAFLQIFLMNLVNICFIVYYICINPYKSKIIFMCSLVSEIITESALMSSMWLAVLDLNQQIEVDKRLLFGWIIVGANLALLYWLCFAGIIKILLTIYEKRKRTKILNDTKNLKN